MVLTLNLVLIIVGRVKRSMILVRMWILSRVFMVHGMLVLFRLTIVTVGVLCRLVKTLLISFICCRR